MRVQLDEYLEMLSGIIIHERSVDSKFKHTAP
jgi:hypothetical protein